MKKFIYMAVAAIAALSSCSSDNDPIMGETGKQTLTFTASMESGVTRATYNSSEKCASWETTDQISINGKTYNAQSAGLTTTFTAVGEEATLDGGKYKAYFPASMYNSSTVTLPASYTYAEGGFDMPMYAESTTNALQFYNLCGVLAITVPSTQMSSVTSIVVSSDKQMNGAISSITDAGVLTFASATLTDAEKKVTLTTSSAVTISSSVTFYVPVPAGTHNPLKITVSDGTTTKTMTTKKSGGVTVARNKIYPITFADNAANPHLLSGSFTVASGKTVKFTKSNLYWSNTDSKFHFEAKPTDYLETRNQDHVCHFFWTKDKDKSYAATYGDGTNETSDRFFADGSNAEHTLTVDGISNLYVLSNAEWRYLLEERDNAPSLFKYGVTVNSKANCLVIAPDGFSSTIEGNYTLEALENAGLVCLPPAEFFDGSSVNDGDLGSCGVYWSSTPNESDASAAHYMLFDSSNGVILFHGYRNWGMSLRAVRAE